MGNLNHFLFLPDNEGRCLNTNGAEMHVIGLKYFGRIFAATYLSVSDFCKWTEIYKVSLVLIVRPWIFGSEK